MARSAKSETLTDRLSSISHPTLLVWGRDDQITPPEVAHLFQAQMPHAELHFIDKCGHAPMVEHPEEFNRSEERRVGKGWSSRLVPAPYRGTRQERLTR